MSPAPFFRPVQRPGRAISFGVLLVLGLLFGCAVVAAAADDDEKDEVEPEMRDLRQKLASVKEWQGVWERSVSGSKAGSTGGGGHFEANFEQKTHGSFLMKRYQRDWNPRRGILSWIGDGEAVGFASGSYFIDKYSYIIDQEERAVSYQGTTIIKDMGFAVWLGGKHRHISFRPGTMDEKTLPRWKSTARYLNQDDRNGPVRETKVDRSPAAWISTWLLEGTFGFDDAKARDRAVVFGGSTVLEFVNTDRRGADSYDLGGVLDDGKSMSQRSRLLMFPVYDNLEVEVTIEGYDDWRPKGTIADPKQPGNNLVVRATLKNKDGAPAQELPTVRRFIFELKDTSHEPGVCLNWPLNAKDNDPDLRLVGGLMGGELSDEDQKLVVKIVPKDEQGQPYTEAKVDSYDFGGRAELRVTCELDDGREVIGLLKGEKGEVELVRIPKTNGDGWIAERWRQKKGVTDLPDNDDEEKVEGQDYKGDGFTLYEEYRGFVENGVRIECDPKKKDLFIVNMADVASREGLSLLERIAKLRVHGRLREDKEMNTTARLMNGNHRAAPHRVDQHGVILSNSVDINNYKIGRGGAQVPVAAADPAKAARPRDTSYCYVVSPDARYGIFSATSRQLYSLTHLSVNQLYAAAVAHELLHAIGVDHHGEQLMELRWGEFQSFDNPKNPTGKPRFLDEALVGVGPPVFFLWEDNGASVAEDQQAVFNQYVSESVSGDKDWYREAAEYWCNRPFFIGKTQGTDSGDEPCVMRYYFATAYAVKGKANTFYVIRPGAKQAETTVCTGSKGTGGNAAGHTPQPRFGDAVGGRGNCFAQICPNDAIPPRSIKLK